VKGVIVLVAALSGASAVALAVTPTASAKGCVRIQAALAASAGDRVQITIRTYASTAEHGQVVPGAPIYLAVPRFKVIAEGPKGRTLEVTAMRRGRSAIRVARVSFPAPGVWRLRAANWRYAPRSCAPPAIVRVR
jgi:hypothetical protein